MCGCGDDRLSGGVVTQLSNRIEAVNRKLNAVITGLESVYETAVFQLDNQVLGIDGFGNISLVTAEPYLSTGDELLGELSYALDNPCSSAVGIF